MNNQATAAKAISELGWKLGDTPMLLDDIEHGSYAH